MIHLNQKMVIFFFLSFMFVFYLILNLWKQKHHKIKTGSGGKKNGKERKKDNSDPDTS